MIKIQKIKILISNSFKWAGRNTNSKFGSKGKYLIPGTIGGVGNGTRYPVCLDVDFTDLIKGYIYLIDYKLVKKVDIIIYNKILEEKLYLSNDSNGEDLDLNLLNDNNSESIDYSSKVSIRIHLNLKFKY